MAVRFLWGGAGDSGLAPIFSGSLLAEGRLTAWGADLAGSRGAHRQWKGLDSGASQICVLALCGRSLNLPEPVSSSVPSLLWPPPERIPATHFSITYLRQRLREDLVGGATTTHLNGQEQGKHIWNLTASGFQSQVPWSHPELQTRTGTLPSRRPCMRHGQAPE